jgi:hypothetical protein
MNPNGNISLVQEIMLDFARLTQLESVNAPPRRYLWTDAFAVCNYLELFSRTNDKTYRDLALRLVEQVHFTLGRHRSDDARRGWISGLDNEAGEQHPTIGGLRIGKQLNERGPDDPPNEQLEWERDGQYYHYLTKWMHALNCIGKAVGNQTYLRWAIELAKTAHRRFTYTSTLGGRKRIYWKMSIDLGYPLVLSMGQHDPLDGYVTYNELHAATRYFRDLSLPNLKFEIADMAEICRDISLVTADPLGIGGLLFDASRLAQLIIQGNQKDIGLLETIVKSAQIGIEAFAKEDSLGYPGEYRLAFRELGLSIGLSAVENLLRWFEESPSIFSRDSHLYRMVEGMMNYVPLRDDIQQFWSDRRNREIGTWIDHREINMVMLATSLAPRGFLLI